MKTLILGAIALLSTVALAGPAPERAVIVVNAESWESQLIANEYCRLRQIPPGNLIEVTGLSSPERIGVDEFREKILGPVVAVLEERGLGPQIEYVLYSADLPTAIDVAADIGDRKLSPAFTPVGSINGLTFLHQLVAKKDVRYLELQSNRYARRIAIASSDTAWSVAEQKRYRESLQQLQEIASSRRERKPGEAVDLDAEAKSLKEAVEGLKSLRESHPKSADLLYNLACGLARSGETDAAFEALTEAVSAGFAAAGLALQDEDLKELRDDKRFQTLIERMKATPVLMQPAAGFRASGGWSETGEPLPAGAGASYWLSTVLAVTRGRGLTVDESLANLARSAAADHTFPKGTVYFEQNDDVRSTTREWGFRSSAERLKALGVNAVVERGVLPQRRDDVVGVVVGFADFDWAGSQSTILPGAICEHLTSFGGAMTHGAGQTPLTEFLRHGAAGSAGTVTEPYAIQAKFPTPFLHVPYAQGCSLGEAFYQAVAGPYQLLIVGDALCQPWGRRLTVDLAESVNGNPLRGTVRLSPSAKSPEGIAAAEFELFVDGRRHSTVKPGEPFVLDTAAVDDGPHELSILCTGTDALRTTGRFRRSVTVRNTDRIVSVHCEAGEKPWGKPFAVSVAAQGAIKIEVRHGGKTVASAEKGDVLEVDPRAIGPGRVSLIPVATFKEGPPVRGLTLDLSIARPE